MDSEQEPTTEDARSTQLAEVIARHFAGATIAGQVVALGFADLRIHCRVHAVQQHGSVSSASLFFSLSGGPLGEAPIFASISGYQQSAEAAIIEGGCQWACTAGPLLRAAFADRQSQVLPESQDPQESERVEVRDVVVHGQPMRLYIEGIDRAMALGPGEPDPALVNPLQAARARFGQGRWLAERVINAERLPLLPEDRATVLSVFCSDMAAVRTIEVKVNGHDWPAANATFADVADGPAGVMVLLRELALLVPQGPAPALSRSALQPTLSALSGEPRAMTAWRGWEAHQGRLDAPLAPAALTALERDVGPLPADYRAFLSDVAAGGAGPGYGLLSPDTAAQRRLARGAFPFTHEDRPGDRAMQGALALANGGCSVVFVLVLGGVHRGEVWVYAVGADGGVRRAAPSFSAWYRAWIDACVRDDFPWLHWDSSRCSTPDALSQALTAYEEQGLQGDAALRALVTGIKPGGLTVLSSGSEFFARGDLVDPCAGCVALCQRLGLSEDVFPRGTLPIQARPAPRLGWLARLRGKS